jgi:hypothetical protein
MRALMLILGFSCLATATGAQEIEQITGQRNCPLPPCCPPAPTIGPDGKPVAPDANAPPATDAFAQASEGGSAPEASFQPGFMGDLIGISATRFVVLNNNGGNGFGGGGFGPTTAVLRVPIAARSGDFKMADGESPRPQDRIYYDYNFYNDVNRTVNAASGQVFQVNRHIIGLEKTFLNGDASVGLRLPFVSVSGVPGLEDSRFADMSIVTKYAFINDPQGGRLVSAGLVVTVPTGGGIPVDLPNPVTGIIDGSNPTTIYETTLQPFVGAIRTLTPNLYAQGFSSVIIPTDSRDVTILTGDVGLGYWLYRNPADRFVQALVPVIGLHTNTPLNKGPNAVPIGFSQQTNLTGGAYVVLPRSTAGFAVCVPLVGPKPYEIEYAVNYLFRF